MASVSKRADGRPGYVCRWRDESGRQHKKSFRRKVDADRFRTEVEHKLHTGAYVDPSAGRQIFREYAEAWRARQPHRPITAERIRSQLTKHAYPVLGDRPLAAIRPSEVQAFVAGLDLKPGSVRTIFATVRAILAAAVHDRLIARDPCSRISLPGVERKRVVPLSVDQVDKLAGELPKRVRAIVTVAAGTGMRQGELFGMQVADVDFLRRTVRVERQIQPAVKGGARVAPLKNRAAYRSIPIGNLVVTALAAHLREHPAAGSAYVFTTEDGQPWTRATFGPMWRASRERADLPEVGMHDLRHFYASALIAAGLSVKVVGERLGHSNAAMTLNVYSHLFPDDEDRTRTAIDNALGRVA